MTFIVYKNNIIIVLSFCVKDGRLHVKTVDKANKKRMPTNAPHGIHLDKAVLGNGVKNHKGKILLLFF